MFLKNLFKRKKKNATQAPQMNAAQFQVPGSNVGMQPQGGMQVGGQQVPYPTPAPQKVQDDRTMLLQDVEDDGRTMLLIDEPETDGTGGPIKELAVMELMGEPKEGVPYKISILSNKKVYNIGRSTKNDGCPDIAFSKDIRTIGRKHAKIEIMGEEIYLTDLGSTNHTTLDGEILDPNRPYPLKEGSVIGFTISNPINYCFHIK